MFLKGLLHYKIVHKKAFTDISKLFTSSFKAQFLVRFNRINIINIYAKFNGL